MVKEIVLAIDPALRKIEEILLWKNKLKSCAVFTFCHFLFWYLFLSYSNIQKYEMKFVRPNRLFQTFNIRTYCTLSCIGLILHLLDAYRIKKKREIMRLQANKNIIESKCAPNTF